MIKTILVPASGSSTDRNVFTTALAVGRPLGAHLEFLHIRLSPGIAALHAPHVDFLQGAALGTAVAELQREETALSSAARVHFDEFCQEHRLPLRATPQPDELVSAQYLEETDQPLPRLLQHARRSDLTVVGRHRNRDYLPEGLIESLLGRTGRPVLIAGDQPLPNLAGTIVVGWKETPEATRALAVAMPLLKQARRVVLLGIREEVGPTQEQLAALAQALAWHGIEAEASLFGEESRPTAPQLLRAAAQLEADLLVAGAFGHGALRVRLFGGVTRALLEHADFPILMMQ